MLDFQSGPVKRFVSSSQQVIHMNSSHSSDLVLFHEDECARMQRARCESVTQTSSSRIITSGRSRDHVQTALLTIDSQLQYISHIIQDEDVVVLLVS